MVTTITKGISDTAPTTGASYGPIAIGAGNKLTRVEFRGSAEFPVATLTSSTTGFFNYVISGIQMGPHGYTPLTIADTAHWDNGQWLILEQRNPGEIGIAWAPSTDTAAEIGGGKQNLTWTGQQLLAAATDLYFTTGQWTGAGETFKMYGTFKAWFALTCTRIRTCTGDRCKRRTLAVWPVTRNW